MSGFVVPAADGAGVLQIDSHRCRAVQRLFGDASGQDVLQQFSGDAVLAVARRSLPE